MNDLNLIRALRKTKNSGLQNALDWLGDHEDSTGEDSGAESSAAVSVPEAKVRFQVFDDDR